MKTEKKNLILNTSDKHLEKNKIKPTKDVQQFYRWKEVLENLKEWTDISDSWKI